MLEDQYTAAAETVCQVTPKQAKDAARHGRNPEQQANPFVELGRSRFDVGEFHQRRANDQG